MDSQSHIGNPGRASLNHRTRHERRFGGIFVRSTFGKSMETSTIRFACTGRQTKGCQAVAFAACKMSRKDDEHWWQQVATSSLHKGAPQE